MAVEETGEDERGDGGANETEIVATFQYSENPEQSPRFGLLNDEFAESSN